MKLFFNNDKWKHCYAIKRNTHILCVSQTDCALSQSPSYRFHILAISTRQNLISKINASVEHKTKMPARLKLSDCLYVLIS